ncbi:MAG: hypothetical protein FJ100_20970 [Deltaproteobacteria bacterium]|nr:hypothetical protein [Deltaproteobacteria bacterium]
MNDLDPHSQAPTDPQGRALGGPIEEPLALAAVGAIADVALAPVQEIRRSPWLLRFAMVSVTMAALAVWFVAWHTGQPDVSAYAVGGIATTVLVGNFMRWRRRWGWVRRGLHLAAAWLVLAGWTALLVDRAVAGQPADPTLGEFVAGSAWFWLPAAANGAAAVLLVGHFAVATRRDRKALAGAR